jgi:hypothetical protein
MNERESHYIKMVDHTRYRSIKKTSRKATVMITRGLSPRFNTKITVSFSTMIQNNVNTQELKSIQAINALQ